MEEQVGSGICFIGTNKLAFHSRLSFNIFCSLKVKVIYDDNFKGKFGDDTVNAARRVLAQAQNAFMWKDSLTTVVKFKVDSNVDYHAGKWVAENDM